MHKMTEAQRRALKRIEARSQAIDRAIHEAVLVERERCAEVALVQAKQGATAEQIAAAIRAGESHE